MSLKVVFLGQTPPPLHGASLLNQRALSIISKEHEVIQVNYNFSTNLKDIGGISIRKLIKLIAVIYELIKLRFLGKYLCYFSANVTGGAFFRDLLVAFVLKITGVRIVYHLHGVGINENSKNLIYRIMYRLMFSKMVVVCVSETVARNEFLWLEAPDFSIRWATNGISMPISHLNNTNHFKICHMSNLRESKGIMDVLMSFKEVKKSFDGAKLTVIGGFRDEVFERKCIGYVEENKLSNAVDFCGVLSGREKYLKLSESDVFLYPTYDDSFGLVMLEAMSQGLLVVAYDEGSCTEIIPVSSGVGEVVQKGDVQGLTEAVCNIFSYRSLYLNKIECRDFVRANFPINRFDEELKNILIREI